MLENTSFIENGSCYIIDHCRLKYKQNGRCHESSSNYCNFPNQLKYLSLCICKNYSLGSNSINFMAL